MKVGELCTRSVVVIDPEATTQDAARLMREHNVGDLVVVERGANSVYPAGIVTDRDLVMRVMASGTQASGSIPVREVMTRGLTRAREDEELFDALQRMRTFGVRRIPVVDPLERLVGILSFDDVFGLLCEELGALNAVLTRERRASS